MSKKIHYLLTSHQLTGDSIVEFFSTNKKAKAAFDKEVNPLIKVCEAEGLDDDTYYSNENPCAVGATNGANYRFNNGENEALDEAIGDDGNVYYEYGTVEVADDVNAYYAKFAEWVDEGSIFFMTFDKAIAQYEADLKEHLEIAKDRYQRNIDRADRNTWENKQVNGTEFSEGFATDGKGHVFLDAFFGYYIDCYETNRVGLISGAAFTYAIPAGNDVPAPAEPNKNDTVYVVIDPRQFSLGSMVTGGASILIVTRNKEKAIGAAREALKEVNDVGYDIENDDDVFANAVETEIVQ